MGPALFFIDVSSELHSAAFADSFEENFFPRSVYRAFLHRENPTFKIWQRMGFVVVIRSYGKGHKEI